MNENKRFGLRNLLSTVLVIALAFCIALTVACSDASGADTSSTSSSSSSSSSSVSARTDYQVVTNGDFEFGTDEKAASEYPVSSSINWTRSNDSLLNSATSSSKLSGIIDTDPDVYKEIAESQNFAKVSDAEDAAYFNPRTPEYYGLVGDDDLYTEDPDNANDDKKPTSGTKVLMIHNVTSEDGRGTAQKFTSTKTFEISAYGKISVWVATYALKTVQDTDEFGAYVQLRTTIDSEVSPLTVKNINTDGEWIKVTFYVAAHDYATTKMRMVVGLGFGSKDVRQEYVEGFAYFDNVTYTELTKEEYEAVADTDEDFEYYTLSGEGKSELVEKDALTYSMEAHKKEVADNENHLYTSYEFGVDCTIATVNTGLDYFVDNNMFETKVNDNYAHADAEYGNTVESGYATFDAIANNALVADVEYPFEANEKVLYIFHPENASSCVTLKDIAVNDDEVLYISFYVKVSTDMNMTGLAISMKDHGSTATKPTSLISAFTTKNYEDENYSDWAKVSLFITNKVGDGEMRYFDLILDFGTTDEVTDYKKLTTGYALVANVCAAQLTQEEYNKAESSDYVGMGSLGADLPNGFEEDETDDTYTFNYAGTNKTTIMNKPADGVIGYTGIVGGHKMTGGTNSVYTQDETVAGIINTKYLDNYDDVDEATKAALVDLEKEDENEYLQPLMIYNKVQATFGYVSSSRTITSGSTTLVSVKVKVVGNAKAYIYLVNADMLEGFDVLDLTTYKYDNDKHEVTEEVNFTRQFVQTVTAAESADGWVTVNFLVTAGETDIEYRIELWNGSRDGAEKSVGTVLFDTSTTSSASDNTAFVSKIKADYPEATEELTYTRVPTKVNYVEDDKDAVRYETFAPSTVYTQYAGAKTIIASYETIDVTSERTDATTEDETDSTSDSSATTTQPGTDVGLQIASIIIALVLVLVLIVVGIRMILKKTKKDKVSSETYYSRDSREKAQQIINANKAKREAAAKAKMESSDEATAETADATEEAPAEEELPAYDYDDPEKNMPKDETEGDATTETATEATDGETEKTE